MPSYMSPGVYVQEVSSGSKPIEGVGTATAAFVGLAEKGPINEPTLVTNWTQFTTRFGDFVPDTYLAHAVYGYFLNGGGAAYIVRVGSGEAAPEASAKAALPLVSSSGGALRLSAVESGPTGDELVVEVLEAGEASDGSFKIVVSRNDQVEETFDNVTAKRGPQNVVSALKRSKLIRLEEATAGLEAPLAHGRISLSGGRTPIEATIGPDAYIGSVSERSGFAGLEAIDEVTMLSVPDLMWALQKGLIDMEGFQAVQLAMIAHCELMADRMAILDAPPGLTAQQVKDWRIDKAGYDSKFAALVLAVGDGDGSLRRPTGRSSSEWTHRGGLGEERRHSWCPQGARQRGRPRGHQPRAAHYEGRARRAQPGGYQLHPGLPGPRHQGMGGTDHGQ